MVYTLFVSEVISAFILAATLLWRYGDCYRNHIIVTVSVLTAWYFSFLIMFLLPLDVTSTVYRQCLQEVYDTTTKVESTIHNDTTLNTQTDPPSEHCQKPWSYVPDDLLFPHLWRIVYWSSQFLTWLIMPMMQSYSKAGDFTVKGKLKSALIDNAIYYGSYLSICGILLIYLAMKPGINLDGSKIKAIASSASNTWGLFLLIFMLGYALVEVPRSLWNNSKKNYTLTYSYFKAAKLSTEKCEAEETVEEILDALAGVANAVGSGHPLSRQLEEVLQKVPTELRDKISQRTSTQRQPPTLKSLVNLHKKTIKSLHVLQRTETQWNMLVDKIFHLEDITTSFRSPDRRFKHSFPKPKSKLTRIFYGPTIEWYWECFLKQYFLKSLAVVTALLSICVVWSEITFFSKDPVLSIFANIVRGAKHNYNYGIIVSMSTLVIMYLCYCAYSTVLSIRFLNLYYLAPHHQTNEHSLIFSGMMACRLTPPLCLNFLGLIHMDSHIIKERIMETAYTQIMGHMDVLSIIADGFNIYFPMALLLFCTCSVFSLGSRLLSLCGFQQFVGDDELTTDLVDEGREIIKRERRKRQRALDSAARRRDFIPTRQRDQNDGAHTGLLADTDYYDGTTEPRLSLEDELDRRFGDSTRVNEGRRTNTMSAPPRGLFDDV